MNIHGMNPMTLACIGIEQSFVFYKDLLGLKPLVKWSKGAYFLDPDGHKLEIHTGDWQSRIHAKKADSGSWKNIEWFI